jgi:hypothetical protein
VEILREAYTEGRLDLTEFDERTTAAYAARTWAQLRELTSDLPVDADLGGTSPRRPAGVVGPLTSGQVSRPGQGPVLFPFLPVVIFWFVVAGAANGSGLVLPAIILLFVWLRLARRRSRLRLTSAGRPGPGAAG